MKKILILAIGILLVGTIVAIGTGFNLRDYVFNEDVSSSISNQNITYTCREETISKAINKADINSLDKNDIEFLVRDCDGATDITYGGNVFQEDSEYLNCYGFNSTAIEECVCEIQGLRFDERTSGCVELNENLSQIGNTPSPLI